MAHDNLWMPLYIGDYLADTMHLDGPQHGAYCLLLMHYWRSGPLPADTHKLAQIARFSQRVWDRDIWPVVKEFFRLGEDGLLHQKRQDIERAKAEDRGEQWRQKREAGTERMRRWRASHNGDHPPPDGNDVTRHEDVTQGQGDTSPERDVTHPKRDNTTQHKEKNPPPNPPPRSGGGRVSEAKTSFSAREDGTNPRATNTNPRANGTNQRPARNAFHDIDRALRAASADDRELSNVFLLRLREEANG